MEQVIFSPLLSIIIPVYNRQDLLDRLINDLQNSITDHDLSDYLEIIIIDDSSPSLIKLIESQFNFILKRNADNFGAPVSRKLGFRISHGKFIHFHDSDDSIDSKWLVSLVDLLKKNPEIDVLLSARVDTFRQGIVFRVQKYFDKYHDDIAKIRKRLIYRNCMGPL